MILKYFSLIPSHLGMISRLDESVGKTMEALVKKGILDNTIVLLYSDNGAPTVGLYANTGSNYPFRGVNKKLFSLLKILKRGFLFF